MQKPRFNKFVISWDKSQADAISVSVKLCDSNSNEQKCERRISTDDSVVFEGLEAGCTYLVNCVMFSVDGSVLLEECITERAGKFLAIFRISYYFFSLKPDPGKPGLIGP